MHLSSRSARNGSTLVVTLFVVVLLTTFIGLALDYTSSTSRLAVRGRDLTTAQALADGALEAAYMGWQKYMVPRQGSVYAKVAIAGFTSAADFDQVTSPLVTALNTASSGSNFYVKALSIRAVDQMDRPCDYWSDNNVTTGPLLDTPGWTAKQRTYRAVAVVARRSSSTDTQTVVSVSRYFQQAEAGLMQAMYFFQNDLELHAGPNMTLYGLVHTNSNMYACAGNGSSLTFMSNVSYAGSQGDANPAATRPSNFYESSDNHYVEGVTQTQFDEESRWTAFSNPTYPSTRDNQLSKVNVLNPLGLSDLALDATNYNGTSTHEIIERPYTTTTGTPSTITASTKYTDIVASHRLFNNAGLRVFINRNVAKGAQVVHVYQPGVNAADSVEIVPTGVAKTANVADQIIAAITPSAGGDFTDAREGHPVNVSTVDVSKLVTPLSNSSLYNGVVYITDVTNLITTSDGTAAGNAKLGQMGDSDAIRLKNGGTLPDAGLTVVSDGAIYVQGDYNTGSTYNTNGTLNVSTQPNSDLTGDPTQYTYNGYVQKPSAVIGDAVMILSNAWVDANSNQQSSQKTGVRVATDTTINTAVVTGQVLTQVGTSKGSGGAHNLPRFLEDWSGQNLTYYGSMCELYASEHFTAPWSVSTSVYAAPNRAWYFDDRFLTTQPPGNLRATNYLRGRWVRNQLSGNELQ